MTNIQMKVSQHEYKSSYEPDAFGPAFWFTLHNGASAYPEEPTFFLQQGMIQLLQSVPFLLPCVKCREHYFTYLRNINLNQVVQSRETLFTFLVQLHNYVNRMNGKPEMLVSVAKNIYGFDNPGVGTKLYITYS